MYPYILPEKPQEGHDCLFICYMESKKPVAVKCWENPDFDWENCHTIGSIYIEITDGVTTSKEAISTTTTTRSTTRSTTTPVSTTTTTTTTTTNNNNNNNKQ